MIVAGENQSPIGSSRRALAGTPRRARCIILFFVLFCFTQKLQYITKMSINITQTASM